MEVPVFPKSRSIKVFLPAHAGNEGMRFLEHPRSVECGGGGETETGRAERTGL